MSKVCDWVVRHHEMLKPGGAILDLAAGKGRHSVFLADRGYDVTAVDINTDGLQELKRKDIKVVQADLENGPWPFDKARFDSVVVTNYLWRALFPKIKEVLRPGGMLIYETFAMGNERFGRPRSPDFLLKEKELLELVSEFDVLDYHHSIMTNLPVSLRQGVVARKPV